MGRIYLDNAATTPALPEVVEAMIPHFTETFGNPSGIHACGQEAKAAVAFSRAKVASLIGADEEEIVFTGGGSEADNLALKGVAFNRETRGKHIITSSIEHHAVLEACEFLERHGFTVTRLKVDKYGLVRPEDVAAAITGDTALVSIMHANNEIGTIEPIAEIAAIAREHGVLFHTDAVQTAGHIPLDVKALGVDMLSMSAHKLYGPKGVGALYVRKGLRLEPLVHGGGQEKERRAGTENVAGIVGFGVAAEVAQRAMVDEGKRLSALRDRLVTGLFDRIDNVSLNGHPERRLPNNANLSFAYVEGESMLLNLDLEGICVSTGSACSSRSLEPSHVLLAIGLKHEEAHGSIRFTLGRQTTEEDIERVLEVMPRIVANLRAMSPLMKNKG